MLGWLIEGLHHAEGLDGITLATSDEAADDAITNFANAAGLQFYRGPLHDVAARILGAARAAAADAIVRVSGDSPLLDPRLVTEAVELFRSTSVDIVTNVRRRTFPKGQSVEVIAVPALERAVRAMVNGDEREHVTPYIYNHPDDFVMWTFQAKHPRPELQLSVDSEDDFRRVESILIKLAQPPWCVGWEQIADLSRTIAV